MVDILIIIVVLINAFFGYLSGMVMQIAWIVTIVAGVILGILLGPVLGAVMPAKDQISGNAIGFLLIFLMIFGACHLMGSSIKVYVNKWKLENHDRTLGALLGAVKALVIAAVVCTGYVIWQPTDSSVRDSYIGSRMVRVCGIFVTEDSARKIQDWTHRVEKTIREGLEDMDSDKDGPPETERAPKDRGPDPSIRTDEGAKAPRKLREIPAQSDP